MNPSTAQCPNHRYGQVTFTCKRCGTFGCNACRSPVAGPLCSACGSRAAGTGLPVLETMMESIQFLLRRPGLLMGISGVYALQGLLLSRAKANLFMVGVDLLFTVLCHVFLVRYVGSQLDDPESTVGDALGHSVTRLLPSIGSNVMVLTAAMLGLLVLIIPGIFLMVALAMAFPAVVLHDAGAFESLQVSWQRTENHRLSLLLLLLLTIILCGVLGLSGAFVQFVLAEKSRMGAQFGLAIAQASYGLATALSFTVLVFGYLKLCGEWTGERS